MSLQIERFMDRSKYRRKCCAEVCTTFDEVARPDMVAALRPEARAGPIVEPRTAALWLLLKDLRSLLPPDPVDPLVVYDPASPRPQQRSDLPVAMAAILPGQLHDVGGQPFFAIIAPRPLALRRAVLPGRPADPALGQSQL